MTRALFQTEKGDINVELFPVEAPGTVANFVKLIETGFYDGLQFHRVIPDFVIQGGCPNTREGASGTPGTAEFHFTRKAQGPLELTLDGVRVPVEPTKKDKKARTLFVTGLTPGKHRFFIYSPRDAFGPDQGEFEMVAGKGVYLVTFAQAFNAVLYGKPDAITPAEGIPGVRAYLVP